MVWDIFWIFDQNGLDMGYFGIFWSKSVLDNANVDVWSERTRSCSGGGPGPPGNSCLGFTYGYFLDI